MKKIILSLMSVALLAGCASGIDYKSEGKFLSDRVTNNVMCMGFKGHNADNEKLVKAKMVLLKSESNFDQKELEFWVNYYNDLNLISIKNDGIEYFCNHKKR